MSTLRMELSPESVRKAKGRIEAYIDSLPDRCDELCRRLGEIGVATAKATVSVDTGQLQSGISLLRLGRGDYVVVSVGDYVAFVEFGTGVVGQGTYEGELPAIWGYDERRTPEAHDALDPTRWYYYDEEGRLRSTRGQSAQSYMASAAEAMRQQVMSIAREVFRFE